MHVRLNACLYGHTPQAACSGVSAKNRTMPSAVNATAATLFPKARGEVASCVVVPAQGRVRSGRAFRQRCLHSWWRWSTADHPNTGCCPVRSGLDTSQDPTADRSRFPHLLGPISAVSINDRWPTVEARGRQAAAESDPAVQAGLLVADVRPWFLAMWDDIERSESFCPTLHCTPERAPVGYFG
jgi:hypothetical protein